MAAIVDEREYCESVARVALGIAPTREYAGGLISVNALASLLQRERQAARIEALEWVLRRQLAKQERAAEAIQECPTSTCNGVKCLIYTTQLRDALAALSKKE